MATRNRPDYERPARELRVCMHVFEAAAEPADRPLLAIRRRKTQLGLESRYAASVEREGEGERIDFVAADRLLLSRFMRDFEGYLECPHDHPEGVTARLYEHGGTGARDPRTGAVVARYRDAIRGHLDLLFEAHRTRPAEA